MPPRTLLIPAGFKAIRKRRNQAAEVLSRWSVYLYCPWRTSIELVDCRWRYTQLASLRATTEDGLPVEAAPIVSWRTSDALKTMSTIRDVDDMVRYEARSCAYDLVTGVPSEQLRSRAAIDSVFLLEFRKWMQESGVEIRGCRLMVR